jgi:Uma2 family endonuclease
MTSMPAPWLGRLLSLEEWVELELPESVDAELVEGIVIVVPKPAPRHQFAMGRLFTELNRQLPPDLTAVPDVDVVLRAERPATVREPDLVVVASVLAEADPPRFHAADVVLAVEIVSAGTKRTDRVTKMDEYAEAGIGHYWILEPDAGPLLTAHVLVDGAYEVQAAGDGDVRVLTPAPLAVTVPDLFRR